MKLSMMRLMNFAFLWFRTCGELTMKFNFFKNFLAAIAIWTMIFSPVAFGLQSQAQFDRITQNQIKSMLIDLGLNRKTTYLQFWDRTKHLYPVSYTHLDVYKRQDQSCCAVINFRRVGRCDGSIFFESWF